MEYVIIIIMQVILGIAAIIYIVHFCMESNRIFREATVPVRATILRVEKVANTKLHTGSRHSNTVSGSSTSTYYTYDPIVLYKYQGKEYQTQVLTNNIYPNRFIVGDDIVLLVNPNNPLETNFKPSMNEHKQYSEENEQRLRFEYELAKQNSPTYQYEETMKRGFLIAAGIFCAIWLILFILIGLVILKEML